MNKIKSFFRFVFVYRSLREYQAHATRWQAFKYHVMNGFRRAVMAAMVVIVAGASYALTREIHPRTVYAERQVMSDSLDLKVEDLKLAMIDRLAGCESAGLKEDDGILVFDTNNKASIGVLQFQKKTVIYYYKTLYNQTITAKDAVEIALDADKSYKLAKDVIFRTDKGLTNWVNCTHRLGLESEVAFIKKLSK